VAHAYASILPAEVLDSLSVEAAAPAWLAPSKTADAATHVLVALEQQWIVGFARPGPPTIWRKAIRS